MVICLKCGEDVKDEFATKKVYVKLKLPYPKKVWKLVVIGRICAVCENNLNLIFSEIRGK